MIERLLLFGATGDLAGRYLLPALAQLYEKQKLPRGFRILGTARQPLDDDGFRAHVAGKLEEHAAALAPAARSALLDTIRYTPLDLARDDLTAAMRDLLDDADGDTRLPVAAYFALPPTIFAATAQALGEAGLPAGSRIVVEKPFGDDLESAVALNRLLARITSAEPETAVFRVDHVLGMEPVHNLLGMRLANRILEPIWNSTHVERVDVLWEETIALEGRAGYFDRAGALKDVMQNHMLQVLAIFAMEPPPSLNERDLRGRRVDLLRCVRPPAREQMRARTRRSRYTAGTLSDAGGASGEDVPDYAAEEGVDPARGTETLAEVVLEIDNLRWAGTPFVLRGGKALSQRWKGVIVHFRPPAHMPIDACGKVPSQLRIGLDGPESLTLQLAGSTPAPSAELTKLALSTPLPPAELLAYSRVLLDVLSGDRALSVRGDEAEESWRIVTPVLQAWRDGIVPLEEYPAGSAGPPPLQTGSDAQGRG